MTKNINRRDFLKMASVLSLSYALPRHRQYIYAQQSKPKNVFVLVFDAFSAYDISLYGYQRKTTPNIDRLAERAIVYHNHYAGGNYTTSGTASLLTGTLPWKHRAINKGGQTAPEYNNQNIFSVFNDFYSMGYSHNSWAERIMDPFGLDELIPKTKLALKTADSAISGLFLNDQDLATVGVSRSIGLDKFNYSYSLYIARALKGWNNAVTLNKLRDEFPLGVPGESDKISLSDTFEYFADHLKQIPEPHIFYLHVWPPHRPYRPSNEFYNSLIGDGYKPVPKPKELFIDYKENPRDTNTEQTKRVYNEFIMYCDQQFGEFYAALEKSGELADSIFVLTSDHGELNERGISGHATESLYEPNTRIPLVIFEPGRTQRLDIHEKTSASDIVPTLANIFSRPRPKWTDGVVLPPFSDPNLYDSSRSVYTVRATLNKKFEPLTVASVALAKENYKLHYYFGYDEINFGEQIKLFNIKTDREELDDISKDKPETVKELLAEVKEKLKEADAPYL